MDGLGLAEVLKEAAPDVSDGVREDGDEGGGDVGDSVGWL